MNSARLWVLILAVVVFLAGLGAGVLLAERTHDESLGESPFGEFERTFIREFQLDLERQRLLAGLLDHYNRETMAIKGRFAAEYHMRMAPELRDAGLEYRGLVRDKLLPEEQRPKFDRLLATYVEDL